MNTPVTLQPMKCPNCGRALSAMANGGSIYLRCSNEPPRCGVIWPADTALAQHIERRNEERQTRPLAVSE